VDLKKEKKSVNFTCSTWATPHSNNNNYVISHS